MLYDMRWDEAGNLGQVSMGRPGGIFEAGRFLFWTIDNRLHTVADENYYSYYVYDHQGNRAIKLTGESNVMDVNAEMMSTASALTSPTLYPSPYLVLTEKGYTKHYYAGTERLAARLGCGGLAHIREDVELSANAQKLFVQCLEIIESNETVPCDIDCIKVPEPYEGDLKPIDPEVIPVSLKADVAVDIKRFQIMMENVSGPCHWNQSSAPGEGGPTSWEDAEEVYFYHSDHLGSASWITDHQGDAIQHLQYLPFGEPFVDQHPAGYQERFTFTGKERDKETGYGYFGARYMDYSMMTSFISVDRYASKYPFISPYAYCAWNPIKLTDPNGDTIRPVPGSSPEFIAYLNQAIQYLIDNGADDVYSQLQSNTAIVYVEGISFQDAYDIAFNPASNQIQWCPVAGIYTSEEIMMSPATVLEHEMDHALQTLQNPEQQLVDFATSSDYSNKEEERVITGSEQRTACRLGEISDGQVTRKNHKGRPYEVVSPISTTLKDPSQKLRKPILNVNDLDQVDIIWERK